MINNSFPYFLGTNVILPFDLQKSVEYPHLEDEGHKNVEGYFGPPQAKFIADWIDKLPDGSTIVEIGAWMGKSVKFTAQYLKEKGRKINYTVIDTFKGSQNEKEHLDIVKKYGGSIKDVFLKNTSGLENYFNLIEKDSNEAFYYLKDNSVDLLFIDGDHSFEQVSKDVLNFYSKVKAGGVISGDDYHPVWGVFNAAPVMLGAINLNVFGQIWWTIKK